jgi:hypothetical protein
MRLLRGFQYPTHICLGLNRFTPVVMCRNVAGIYAVGCRVWDHMDADDCARIVEGVAAVLDLLAAGGDAVDDPAPIYELLAERCRHVRVALEVMTGCE